MWAHQNGNWHRAALDEAAAEEAGQRVAQLGNLADGVVRQGAHHREQRAHAQRQPRPQLHHRQPAESDTTLKATFNGIACATPTANTMPGCALSSSSEKAFASNVVVYTSDFEVTS